MNIRDNTPAARALREHITSSPELMQDSTLNALLPAESEPRHRKCDHASGYTSNGHCRQCGEVANEMVKLDEWHVLEPYTNRQATPIGVMRMDGGYDIIGEAHGRNHEANARLIVRAPALLAENAALREALQRLIPITEECRLSVSDICSAYRQIDQDAAAAVTRGHCLTMHAIARTALSSGAGKGAV